ncbi:DNA-directed RNA polymerase subunit H [Candidatus Woesearchaeota archaeon]|nr:DNA-directed RNA polymerase subunit H [Candidatus Woesearchaeota archaeon]
MATDMIHHTLVPKHAKISESEKEKLFEKYTTSAKELPKILKNDPAIAKLSVKEGDIIKVERKSKTAGISFYYRVVMNE